MTIILNILVFSVFLWWFRNHYVIKGKKILIGITALFLITTLGITFAPLLFQNEYLDGLLYLIAAVLSIVAFWLTTTIIIIWKNLHEKTLERVVPDLLQTLPLLLIPILIWFWLSSATFKIGG